MKISQSESEKLISYCKNNNKHHSCSFRKPGQTDQSANSWSRFEDELPLLTCLFVAQAVSSLQELPVDLAVNVPGQTPNWDIVSDIVNLSSRTFRSARQVWANPNSDFTPEGTLGRKWRQGRKWCRVKFSSLFQCRDRYVNMVMPREEGKLHVVSIIRITAGAYCTNKIYFSAHDVEFPSSLTES